MQTGSSLISVGAHFGATAWPQVERRRWPRAERRRRPRPATPHKVHYWEIERDGNRTTAYVVVKRVVDIAGSVALIVFLAPLCLVTWVVLWMTTRGRPIFEQVRIGEGGQPFTLYKFRTMSPDADRCRTQVRNEQSGPVFKNRYDPRITPLGRWLRKFSIDELPQLFNVLKGDMSLVGPRPPILSEVTRYSDWQLRRLSVKPGLTCVWQVSGRCEIGFEDWVRMDLWYIDHQSLRLDVTLLLRTPAAVLSCRGAY